MKTQRHLIISFLLLALTGLTSIVVGTTFAFFSADIKGETVNEVSTSEMKIVYTESQKPSILGVLTDESGIISKDYFTFSIFANTDKNSSFEYYVYLEEEANNTMNKDNIKVFLTDEKDIPVNEEYTTQNLENGIYCYDYLSNKLYTNKEKEYNNCKNIDITNSFYLMDKLYYNNIKTQKELVCREYKKSENNITNEIVESSNCRYGDVYKANPLKYINLSANDTLNLQNIIYKGTYKNIDGVSYYNDAKSGPKKTFRLRLWANGLKNEKIEVIKGSEGQEINQTKKTFKYKVNVYAKQIELSK